MRTLGNKGISCTPRAVSQTFDGHGVFDNRGSCWEAAITTLPSGIHVKGFPFQLERAPLVISCDAPRFGAVVHAT
jgi:hypothetical protein